MAIRCDAGTETFTQPRDIFDMLKDGYKSTQHQMAKRQDREMAKGIAGEDKIKFLLSLKGLHQKALENASCGGYTNIEYHKGRAGR